MLTHKERLTGSTSSGVLTKTTMSFVGGIVGAIRVVPATATTVYDLAITDGDGDPILDENGIQGVFIRDTYIPVRGVLTVSITGASADEAFVIVLRNLEGGQ